MWDVFVDYTGFPRMAKWSVANIITTIEDDVGGAMKQMSRTLVTPYLDEEKRNIMWQGGYFELLSKYSELVNFIEEKSKDHLQNMKNKDKQESDLCNKSVQILEAIFDKKSKLASTDKQKEAVASSVFKEQPDLHRGEKSGLCNADIKEKEEEKKEEEKKEENDESEKETGGGLVPKKVGNVSDFGYDFEEVANIGSKMVMDVQDHPDFPSKEDAFTHGEENKECETNVIKIVYESNEKIQEDGSQKTLIEKQVNHIPKWARRR